MILEGKTDKGSFLTQLIETKLHQDEKYYIF